MDVARTYRVGRFRYDVVEWCMQVETDYICDVDICTATYMLRKLLTEG